MPSQKNQRPIYQRPRNPSDQLKVVLNYFDALKIWDLDTLNKLSTSDFTQQTLPESLGVGTRTKSEDFEYLRLFKDSLNGAPLEVCSSQIRFYVVQFRQLTHIQRSYYTISTRVRAKSGFTYVPFLIPSKAPSREGHHVLTALCLYSCS